MYDKRLVELGISPSGEKTKGRDDSFQKYVKGYYQEDRDQFSLVREQNRK